MTALAYAFLPSPSPGRSCRSRDLPLWLGEELWEVELLGAVEGRPWRLAGSGRRLRRRIDAWGPETAARFAAACAERALAAARAESEHGALYAADAAAYAAGIAKQVPARAARCAAAVALIARQAAAHAAGEGFDAAARELVWQAAWLAERLELDAP